MDNESFTVPNLVTLRRQGTSVPSIENTIVSWEGRIQLSNGEQFDLYLDEDSMPPDQEERRHLAESLTRFFRGEEERLRREVAADLLDLVNLARATREHPSPPLTLDTLLPRLTLEDVDWWGNGASSVKYRVDEPEFEGRPVYTGYDEEGRLEVHTTLLEMLPSGDGSWSSRVPIQARMRAVRAILEASSPPTKDWGSTR